AAGAGGSAGSCPGFSGGGYGAGRRTRVVGARGGAAAWSARGVPAAGRRVGGGHGRARHPALVPVVGYGPLGDVRQREPPPGQSPRPRAAGAAAAGAAARHWTAAALALLSIAGFALQALPGFDQMNGEIIALALPVHVGLAAGVTLGFARRERRVRVAALQGATAP